MIGGFAYSDKTTHPGKISNKASDCWNIIFLTTPLVPRMATPDPPLIQPLTSIYRSHGDYEDLLEWGSFRYHSVIQFNTENPQPEENVALKSLWTAIAVDDENAIEDAAQQCFDILFPFIQADYASRSKAKVSRNET